jgi:site-specific recombinase XerD
MSAPAASTGLLRLLLDRPKSDWTHSPKTQFDYAADWRSFTRWCESNQRQPLPASTETLLLYLLWLLESGRKVTTARRHASAIGSYHRAENLPIPAMAPVWQFLTAAKRLRAEQPRRKHPVTVGQLREMCRTERQDARGARNRAILVLGFASSLRRSNLVAFDRADVEFRDRGVLLRVRREKQDRTGDGRMVAVARGAHEQTCPARLLAEWIEIRGEMPGPLFTHIRNGHALVRRLDAKQIGYIVQTAAGRIGLQASEYGGHSLRAGFVTTALDNGVGELLVAAQTGHHSLATLRLYFRESDPFRANASSMIGL